MSLSELYDVRMPALNGLTTVYIEAASIVSSNAPEQQPHARQHIAARLICNTFASVLATPTRNVAQLLVIGKSTIFEVQTWRDLLHRLSFKEVTRTARTTHQSFESALRFTIMTRLAPEWNRIGNGMVNGVDFLSRLGNNLRCVTPEIYCISATDCHIKAEAAMVRLYAMEPWMLLNDPGHAGNEHATYRQSGDGLQLGDVHRACVLLPKLTHGKVIGWRATLPTSSEFRSYADLRVYWRLNYGYELPVADPPYYFDVAFNAGRQSKPLTYPGYCVLSAMPANVPTRVPPEHLRLVLHGFVQTLQHKLHSVCGEALHVTTKDVAKDSSRQTIAGIAQLVASKTELTPFKANGDRREPDDIQHEDIRRSAPERVVPNFSTRVDNSVAAELAVRSVVDDSRTMASSASTINDGKTTKPTFKVKRQRLMTDYTSSRENQEALLMPPPPVKKARKGK